MGRVVGTTVIFTSKQHWKKDFITTLVFDNIVWKNKDYTGKETHNTTYTHNTTIHPSPHQLQKLEISIIYAFIDRAFKISTELKIEKMFIDANQAIYSKLLDLMFKMSEDGHDVF